MKKIILLTLAVVLFAGCKKDAADNESSDELGIPEGFVTMDGYFGTDDVSIWYKETEIVIDDYYSQIDTVIAERKIEREIKYRCKENETVSVQWSVNGKPQPDARETRIWRGGEQRWIVTVAASLNIVGISEDLKIEAIVQFNDRKARRFKTIPKVTTNKNVSDVFGCTFGARRIDMNNIISYDISPQFASAKTGSTPPHFLEFIDGKLARLYTIKSLGDFLEFDNALDRCKIPELLQIQNGSSFHILNPQEWVVGTLKMKVFNTSMNEILNSTSHSNSEIMCLTIEK
jgi:hypothetical protein